LDIVIPRMKYVKKKKILITNYIKIRTILFSTHHITLFLETNVLLNNQLGILLVLKPFVKYNYIIYNIKLFHFINFQFDFVINAFV